MIFGVHPAEALVISIVIDQSGLLFNVRIKKIQVNKGFKTCEKKIDVMNG